MKHIKVFAIAVCLLASFAAAGTVSAQDHAAKANGPVQFQRGGQMGACGTYIITSDMTNPKVIFIRSEDGKIALLSVTQKRRSAIRCRQTGVYEVWRSVFPA